MAQVASQGYEHGRPLRPAVADGIDVRVDGLLVHMCQEGGCMVDVRRGSRQRDAQCGEGRQAHMGCCSSVSWEAGRMEIRDGRAGSRLSAKATVVVTS